MGVKPFLETVKTENEMAKATGEYALSSSSMH